MRFAFVHRGASQDPAIEKGNGKIESAPTDEELLPTSPLFRARGEDATQDIKL
ncbi:hypothetical protein JCM17844_24870 [Iodidimonas gelatinilytica]|uniref:Uncharacterized protein n=1 Tax=Iodidimonas gelatinilytica TaxID=1236966 RepID=A0A5A7MSD1_9PROT|nr:hypothetical protein JCM17844_24870 [Iodidimonas gelatinilytica]